MRLLTVNAGSASLGLDVVTVDDLVAARPTVLATSRWEGDPTAPEALDGLRAMLREHSDEVDAVAHRLVHGGPDVERATVVDDEVLGKVWRSAALAPLHVPVTLDLVSEIRRAAPTFPQVLCPDTAFHAHLPEYEATCPLPESWRRRYGLRRYGFHGLSHSWALRRASDLLEWPVDKLQLVLAHLGGGCSVTAVRGGRSVATSVGLTPLEGLVMTRRSGSLDPALVLWLLDNGMSRDEPPTGCNTIPGSSACPAVCPPTPATSLMRPTVATGTRPWRWTCSAIDCAPASPR